MTQDLAALKREARRKGTPPERLLELARIGPELAREVARSDNTPPEVLVQMIELCSGDVKTLQNIAKNLSLPRECLQRLIPSVPTYVASNKYAPALLLRHLSAHHDPLVRQAVLFNPSTPLDIAQRLTVDMKLASDTFLLQQMGKLISYARGLKSADETVLRAISLTDFIPAEAALALAQHPNPEIRQALLQHSDKVAQAVRSHIVSQVKGETP